MKVAHVITALSLGGAERVAEDLSLAFRSRGVEPHIIALIRADQALSGFSAAMTLRLRDAGIRVHELNAANKRLGLLAKMPRLSRLIARERFDLVHAHVDHAEFAVSLVRRFRQLPLARTIHNTVLWPGHARLGRLSEGGWHDDLVIAVSEPAMAAHLNLRRSLAMPVTPHRSVILNGVPIVEGGASQHHRGPLRAAFFGRSTNQKGLDVLLEALRNIPADAPPFTMTIHSDAAHDERVRQQVAGIPQVTLVPPVSDARSRFVTFDLVVMPSRFEGLPLVALESLAAGTPVLASIAPGLREVLPEDWPLLVPVGDASALRKAMMAAVRDVEAIRALRPRAAAHGRTFAIGETADRYLTAYDAYLSRGVAPRRF